ncbi:hypothetical protein ACFX2J_017587 [Malus domestica]|nr:signal recognition particle receptor subunit alpha-like [Malus domestica]
MLEQLFIFTRGGLILWTYKELQSALNGHGSEVLGNFIESCLMEELSGAAAATSSLDYNRPGAAYTLKWTFHDELRLVFLSVYDQKTFHDVWYVDELLSMAKHKFLEIYDPTRRDVYNDFDEPFKQLMNYVKIPIQYPSLDEEFESVKYPIEYPRLNKEYDQSVKIPIEYTSPKEDYFESKPVQKAGHEGYKNNGWFSCMFRRMPLEKSDLEPALKALKEKLIMAKNVAEAVAEELCESVAASLEGKKLPWFTTISSAVQAAMEEEFVRILTPTADSSPILNLQKNVPRKPCVFAYIDTTGDWKAISSVKAACRLQKERKNSVIMVADRNTFRSETVKQLRRDAWKLQRIPIFEKRYEKDPAISIKEAVQEARDDGSDVVVHAASPKQAATVLATAYLSGAKVIFRGVGKPYTGEKHTTRKIVKKLFK